MMKKIGLCLRVVVCVVIFLMFNASVFAVNSEDVNPEYTLEDESLIDLPDHPWVDGLYSTVTAHFCANGAEPQNVKDVKIRLSGIKASVPIRISITNPKAPLIILIPGAGGTRDGTNIAMWMSWIEEKGWNSLSFNSIMHPSMIKCIKYGVTGNWWVEADKITKIIQACLKAGYGNEAEKIGIIGMSHGANLALILSKMQKEGKLPFKINAVQAYSPVISMYETTKILDEVIIEMNSNEDLRKECILSKLYWKFYNLKREYPVKKVYNQKEMKVAIARIFCMNLATITLKNDDLYGDELVKAGKKRLLPKHDFYGKELSNDDRRYYAEIVTFGAFQEKFLVPYWQLNGTMSVVNLFKKECILGAGFLEYVLERCEKNVDVVIAVNDPLNGYVATSAFLKSKHKNVTFLSRGGHLGYVNSFWTKARIFSIFNNSED